MKIYTVSFGLYFVEHAEYSYSYWDYEPAMMTFLMYQEMGWDWISFGVHVLSREEEEIATGIPFLP